MNSDNNTPNKPDEILLKYLDERIDSCEKKRSSNKNWMNCYKSIRIGSGWLAVLLIALLVAEAFGENCKSIFNIVALILTSLATLSSTILSEFGYQDRFQQNVKASGKLQTLKSRFELELSLPEKKSKINYEEWFNAIKRVLENQAEEFDIKIETSKQK